MLALLYNQTGDIKLVLTNYLQLVTVMQERSL